MKNMFLKTVGKSAIMVLTVVMFAQAAVFAQEAIEADDPSAENHRNQRSNARRIEGVWDAQVTIRICATGAPIVSLPALGLFARGGTLHDTNSTNPALRTPAFGTWSHVRGNRYMFAFKFFRFDASGNNIGSTIVRHQVTLNPSGDQYTSSGTGEFYDAAGNLTMTGCSSSTATRFD